MTPFQKVKLGDIATVLMGQSPASEFYNQLGDGLPFFQGVKDFGEKYPTETSWTTMAHKVAKKGDVLFSVRAPVGELNIAIKDCCIGRGVAAIRSNNNQTNYLYFLLKSQIQKIRRFGNGSVYDAINKDILEKTIIDIFSDTKTQTYIGSVLSAYDDLIENNEKRIKALEEMAQLLYTEWFVKFKFPGHEKVNIVESGTEYGMIPEGWKVKKLKDIGKAITGKTPSTENLENFNGDVLFIKTPDIHGNIFVLETEQTLSEVGASTQSLKLLPEKIVFVSCIGTLGVVGITSIPSQTNQQINALILNDNSDYCFFYFFAKSLKKRLIGLGSNGATMGNVNKDKFENISIIYPEQKIRMSFHKSTTSLFDEILLLQKLNKNLIKTRDLLIPQLVTGKREIK